MKRGFFTLAAAAMLSACGQSSPDARAQVALYSADYPEIRLVAKPGTVTSPDGLLWHDGALYIADEGGSAVRVLKGGRIATLADASSGLKSPEDLRFSPSGDLFVTDDSAGRVWRIRPGSRGAEAVGGFSKPAAMEGIADAGPGGMVVGDGTSGQIYALGEEGTARAMAGPQWRLAKPESMVRTDDGAFLVADNRADRLYRFAPGGARSEISLPSDLSPESLALAGKDLWITDSHNGRLYRLRPGVAPETVALFSGAWDNINGVTAAPDGTIYVSIQSDLAAKRGVIVALAPAKNR